MANVTDLTCVVCLNELTTSYARNICRHRFHSDCLKKILSNYQIGRAPQCPCCLEEFSDKKIFLFPKPTLSNTASFAEDVSEIDKIIAWKRKNTARDEEMIKIEKKYLHARAQSIEGLRLRRLKVITGLYNHVKSNAKCRFALENMEKICRCSSKTTISGQAIFILDKQLKMSRSARVTLASKGDSKFGQKNMRKATLDSFSPKECCSTCKLPRLPVKIMRYYATGRLKREYLY